MLKKVKFYHLEQFKLNLKQCSYPVFNLWTLVEVKQYHLTGLDSNQMLFPPHGILF